MKITAMQPLAAVNFLSVYFNIIKVKTITNLVYIIFIINVTTSDVATRFCAIMTVL